MRKIVDGKIVETTTNETVMTKQDATARIRQYNSQKQQITQQLQNNSDERLRFIAELAAVQADIDELQLLSQGI